MIVITSDHGGYNLKAHLIKYLNKYQITDLGPFTLDTTDNYPDYVVKLAQHLKQNPQDKGIIICRNGVGVSMMANKYPFINAALSWDAKHAATSRLDDNTNVLALPADYISLEIAEQIVETWLNTPFSNEPRHVKRLEEVKNFIKF